MSKNLIAKLSVIVGILIVGFIMVASVVSFSNKEIDIRNNFNQKESERTAFYDKLFKTINQKTQIAVKNDSSFIKVVNAQVQGQKNGEDVTWAWVKQSNPAATYGEVTKLYSDLSRAVEGERLGFFEQEKMLQDIKRQHDNLLAKFPGSMYNLVLNRSRLKYSPIKSDETEEVMRTGKDNNIKLKL